MNKDHLDKLIEEQNQSLIEAHSLSEETLRELSERVKKNKKTFSIGKLAALVSCCAVVCFSVLATVLLLNRADGRRYSDDGTNCEIVSLEQQEVFGLLSQKNTLITPSILDDYALNLGIGYALPSNEYLAVKFEIMGPLTDSLATVITVMTVWDERFDYTDRTLYDREHTRKETIRGTEVSYASAVAGIKCTEYAYFAADGIRYYFECVSPAQETLIALLYHKILG